MKKLLLLLALITSCGSNVLTPEADIAPLGYQGLVKKIDLLSFSKEKDNLHGNVKKVSNYTEETLWNSDTYNSDGLLIESSYDERIMHDMIHFDSDEIKYKMKYTYTSDGQLEKYYDVYALIDRENPSNITDSERLFFKNFYSNNKIDSSSNGDIYHYNDEGLRTKITKSNGKFDTYEYSDDKIMITISSYDNETLSNTTSIEFDDENKIVSATINNDYGTTNILYENGYRISYHTSYKDGDYFNKYLKNNSKGDPIEQITERSTDYRVSTDTLYVDYTYDSHNNWTSQEQSNGEGKSHTIKREISYY